MGRRKEYKGPVPNQKRPKDHEIIAVDDGLFYLRTTANADSIWSDTITTRKTRNLIALWLKIYLNGIESVNPDEFCKRREISVSNYRRLIALVKEHFAITDFSGNSVRNTPSNKKYMTILALNEEMNGDGVDMQKFCAAHHISRTTFFRYINVIQNFFCHEDPSRGIAIDSEGEYYIMPPYGSSW